jgi:glycosyltransferase involved in cell wall biosynthesis
MEFLIKNLEILSEIIPAGGFTEEVSLIVSDNCSTDNTYHEVKRFKDEAKIGITLYRQDTNIGLKANALFVLEKSTTDYVMYLGDDDFIDAGYLAICMKLIRNDAKTTVIVPNYVPVSVDNELVADSRDLIGPVQRFEPGFDSILKYSWKGHQISGIVLKREGLHDAYMKYGVDNIYPFVFFVSYSGLNGVGYLVKDNPVRVTQPVKKKDWGYGDDGLVGEIFDNYKKLPVSSIQRFRLETTLLYIQNWRLLMYRKFGAKVFWKAVCKIGYGKSSSMLFSLFFPVLLVLIKLKRK